MNASAARFENAHIALATEQFCLAMRERGLIPPSVPIADGKINRYAVIGKNGKGDGAYIFHLDGIPAGGFENHKDGRGWENWRVDLGRRLTPDEEAAHKRKNEAMRQEREAETAKRHAEGQAKAQAILRAAKPAPGDHPMRFAKRLKPLQVSCVAHGRNAA